MSKTINNKLTQNSDPIRTNLYYTASGLVFVKIELTHKFKPITFKA